MSNVNVSYSDFLEGMVEKVQFELLEDKILGLSYNKNDISLTISIADEITDNMELHGNLDYEGVNVLIKALSVIRNRMKIAISNNK